MFAPTKNPYQFQYLLTGVTGEGIKEVYLPQIPAKNKILFAKEKKWVRPEMNSDLKKWVKEWRAQQAADPTFVHPHYDKISEWEGQEVERARPGGTGVFFYNAWEDDPKKEPEIVYITPFHYWYLTAWNPYFGYPTYRDPDREIFYWIQFWEEDPDCFGGLLNTIRRYGKSSIMGAWITYRSTMNYSHNAGMQGEKDEKIAKFYRKMVLKPFYKLPYYFQPIYNTDTKQTRQIEFDLPPQRAKKRSSVEMEDLKVLESMLDYRPSGEEEYDGDILGSYLIEEPGKSQKMSIYNDKGEGTWDIVKPCFLDGEKIVGKALMGTTVENMSVSDKGGRAYKRLFFDSDFNQKQEDGRTVSGMYAAFLPGDCAYKGYIDDHGRPRRQQAKEALLRTRKSFKNNARKLAGWKRKYPLTLQEIFYVSPERCEFNADVLQARLEELDSWTGEPITKMFDLYWKDGKRFGEVLWRHNSQGWLEASWIPDDVKEMNKVGRKQTAEGTFYFPQNDPNFSAGIDPIQHGSSGRETESRPVLTVKTKYKESIDGELSYEDLNLRAQKGKIVNNEWVLDDEGRPYDYKTNKFIMMMDIRPSDPNILFERVLMVCWLLGVSLNVERQFGGALMNYFHLNNCGQFILPKYKAIFDTTENKMETDGTAASPGFIQEGVSEYASYIDYFGHTIPFKSMIDDALIFNAAKTTEHDYTVAAYYTLMGEKVQPKVKPSPVLNLDDYMSRFDPHGNLVS